MQRYMWDCGHLDGWEMKVSFLGHNKKGLGSHQLRCLIFTTTKKRATLLVKYSVLGNMWNAYIFQKIWYFRSPSSFFNFFSDENQDIYFSISPQPSKKKKGSPSSFFNFFLIRSKTFIFHGLTSKAVDVFLKPQFLTFSLPQGYFETLWFWYTFVMHSTGGGGGVAGFVFTIIWTTVILFTLPTILSQYSY